MTRQESPSFLYHELKDIDHWQLFGLAVEWIEERGCHAEFGVTRDKRHQCVVFYRRELVGDAAFGDSYHRVVAEWVATYGHLLRDVAKMVKEGDDG
jgi:hypothetical protein